MNEFKELRLSFCFPGQSIAAHPKLETFNAEPGLAGIVESCRGAFKEAVGHDLASAVLQADNAELEQNTLFAQLKGFYNSIAMWLLFLNYTPSADKPSPGKLIKEGLLKVQLIGDSAGFYSAAHAPGPSHLDDQLAKLQEGARNTVRRGQLMLETPHDADVGGMAATMGLPGGVVNSLVRRANRQLKQDNLMQVVKHNAPALKVVAGPREGLDLLSQYVASKKGKYRFISPYWFHHSMAMELPGKRLGLYLAGEGVFTPSSPLLTYASYVTGRVIPPASLINDLADGVWKPVFFYTFRGPSLHSAMYKNGHYDLIVFNNEVRSWLRDSRRVAAHLMNDSASMAATYAWVMQAMRREVPLGKQVATVPAATSQVLSHSSS